MPMKRWSLVVLVLLTVAAVAFAQSRRRQTERFQFVNGVYSQDDEFIVYTYPLSTDTVTFRGADSAGAANTTYDTTGAGVVTIGSADVTSVSVVTDGGTTTIDGGVALQGPTASVILCGDLPNNTTNYTSPVTGLASGAFYTAGLTANDLSYALAGTGCAAEDNTTEATADEVMFANNAFKVTGLYCAVSGSGSNGVTVNLRSAAANLGTDITVTIPTTETTAAVAVTTLPTVAAGATFAARAITTEDLSAQDFWCVANIVLVP